MNKPLDPKLVSDALDHEQWQAYLRLVYETRARGVRLVKCDHKGPLYVQKAFYPEGPECAHTYLLHPPGGLVSGDELSIEINLEPSSHALITMPGAGRVYRARDNRKAQTQYLNVSIGADAALEWLPLETILFPNANANMSTSFELESGARLITWEITCFGLPANQETFAQGDCKQRLQIKYEGRLVFNDALIVESDSESPSMLEGNAALRGHAVHGMMIAGPFAEESTSLLDALNDIAEQCAPGSMLAVSHTGQFICLRFLGECTEYARKLFTQCWLLLRPALLDKPAVPPRIWLT